MPRFRPDLARLITYVPGKPIEEVAREIGLDPSQIVKLASNESPDGPFPGVVDAITEAAKGSNRYPDSETFALRELVSRELGVARDEIVFGAGSTALLTHIAYGVGGPGTSAVYAWPSFVMYRIISRWAMTESFEVSLNENMTHDLGAMLNAIRADTTVVYVCNPNNPTGTVVPADAIAGFVDAVPDSVLIVIDEAYHDFVDDPSYQSAISLAVARPNVLVLRTFSKIYGLAAHRIGYVVGQPATLTDLQRTQAPFTVTTVAQAAALASLGQPEELEKRRTANASGRHQMTGVLAERDLPHTRSQTNFVYFMLEGKGRPVGDEFVARGVIVRPMSRGWIRVTLGHPEENQRFVAALDEILASRETPGSTADLA